MKTITNYPDDCVNRPDAPWNRPDVPEIQVVTICWYCDKPEPQCTCEAFDEWESTCDECKGECEGCEWE